MTTSMIQLIPERVVTCLVFSAGILIQFVSADLLNRWDWSPYKKAE